MRPGKTEKFPDYLLFSEATN